MTLSIQKSTPLLGSRQWRRQEEEEEEEEDRRSKIAETFSSFG